MANDVCKPQGTAPGAPGFVPDCAIESELAILSTAGCADRLPECLAAGLRAEDFYVPAHRIVFSAMLENLQQHGAYDLMILCDFLRKSGRLEAVGREAGLVSIVGKHLDPLSAGALATHIGIVRAAARRRRAAVAIDSANTRLKAGDMGALPGLEAALLDLCDGADRRRGFRPFADVADEVLNDLEGEMRARTYITGLRSGYHRLDDLTAGFQPDNVYIVAARPGIGKTAFALNLLQNIVLHPHGGSAPPRAAFISAEMTAKGLYRRILSAVAGVDLRDFVQSQSAEDTDRLQRAARVLKNHAACMHVIETQGLDIDRISTALRLAHRAAPFDIVFVDYLQQIPATGDKARDSTVEQVAEVSRKLHGLATSLHLPLVVLAQINRDAAGRAPTLGNLKGSGGVEQDADLVILLDRPEKHLPPDAAPALQEALRDLAVLDVAKNRHGSTGRILLSFDPRRQRFLDRPDQNLPRLSAPAKGKEP